MDIITNKRREIKNKLLYFIIIEFIKGQIKTYIIDYMQCLFNTGTNICKQKMLNFLQAERIIKKWMSLF